MLNMDFSIKKLNIGGKYYNALFTSNIIMYNYDMGETLIILELLNSPFIKLDNDYYNLTKVIKSSMNKPDAVIYKSTSDNKLLICISRDHPEYTYYRNIIEIL